MEQLTTSINEIVKPLERRNNSSIRISHQSRVSDVRSLNQMVFIIEYEKVMEQIQLQPEKHREGIELLKPLFEKSNQIKNSRAKLYYMKENILICLIKLLNKQGDQIQILNYFNQYMPDLIREAKIFQAKKGSIIMLMILWAKCEYALNKLNEALQLLNQASKLLDIFDLYKLNNQLKIYFLKAKIYQQQDKTASYHNQISLAYNIVKSNNILSALGLKITQIYHNMLTPDDIKKEGKENSLNRSLKHNRTSKKTSISLTKARSSLQTFHIQSRFQPPHKNSQSHFRNSNSNTSNNVSNNLSQKQKTKVHSISTMKKSSRQDSKIIAFFQDLRPSPYTITVERPRLTIMTESQINSQLSQISREYKHDSQKDNNHILKRPQYKKYSLCYKSFSKMQQKPKAEPIEEQQKDIQREQKILDIIDMDILGVNRQVHDGQRNSRCTLKMQQDQNISNEDEQQQQEALDIIPFNFPTQYTRPFSSQSLNETFRVQVQFKLCIWKPNKLYTIKKIVGSYDPDLGLYFYIYSFNSPQVMVISQKHSSTKVMTKQYLIQYMLELLKIELDETLETQDLEIKQIFRIMVMKHLTYEMKSPFGNIIKLQIQQVAPMKKKRQFNKDRQRYTRLTKRILPIRKILSEPQLILKTFENIFEICGYNQQNRPEQKISNLRISLQEGSCLQGKQNINELLNKVPFEKPIPSQQVYTGKYYNFGKKERESSHFTSFQWCLNIISKILKENQSHNREFYEMMKYNLIMDQSKIWINEYFNQVSISSLYSISGIGSCKISLKVYVMKPIYNKNFVFLKFQVVPLSTKTKKIKFVVTQQDIKKFVNLDLGINIVKSNLFDILKSLQNKFIYLKDHLYYSLVLEAQESYGYNKFTLYQYESITNPTFFLTPRLKSVYIFKQKTILISLKNKKSFSILTIKQLQDTNTLKVIIHIPSTNRRFSFSLPQRVILEIDSQGALQGNPNWDKILSNIQFNTIQHGAVIANIGSYSAVVIEHHYDCFGIISKYVFQVCFKVFRKKKMNLGGFLSQFQNIIENELTQYEIYLQLNWLKKGRKLCYVFSIIDFIQLIMDLPRKTKSHKQLECKYFSLADIALMLKIGYQKIKASLIQFGEERLQELIGKQKGKYQLQRMIQKSLKATSKNRLVSIPRPLKLSLNSQKQISRSDHLNIIHKGIFRFQDKTLLGIFNHRKNNTLMIKQYDQTKKISISTMQISQLSIPFAGEQKQNILNVCNKRIFKMIKNKLILQKYLNCSEGKRTLGR